MGDLHAAVLLSPIIKSALVDAHFPGDVANGPTLFVLLEGLDDLAFAKLAFFHVTVKI